MPVFTGFEGKEIFRVCSKDECVEYLSEKGAIEKALILAKKSGSEHTVIRLFGEEEAIIGIAKPDGSFEEVSIPVKEEVVEEESSKPKRKKALENCILKCLGK
ncbi:MAG: hypothetical protein AB1420_15815 [Bacillota bacterium]